VRSPTGRLLARAISLDCRHERGVEVCTVAEVGGGFGVARGGEGGLLAAAAAKACRLWQPPAYLLVSHMLRSLAQLRVALVSMTPAGQVETQRC
jgi:hypothetical protein